MIRGRTHRKTMKQPCLILCLSSKENENNTDQAMTSNGARCPCRARRKHRWKPAVETSDGKHQRHANGRNTATSPPACASADSNLSGRLLAVRDERGEVDGPRVKTALETAVMIRGWARRKTMKCPRLDPLALIQGKQREHRSSNGHQRRAPPRWESNETPQSAAWPRC